jgi:predicted alpha-1,6-mannanase (GH76 family)
VLGLAASDDRLHAPPPDQPAVVVVVVAAVSDQHSGSTSWPADAAADGRHPIEKLEELRDVVAVAAGESPGEWDAAAVYQQVVLAAATAPVDGAGTCLGTPFFACRWLESATARSHSS